MLKLTRTLPITWGETSIVLPVVRLVATQKTRHPVALSVPDAPFSIVASESVEIIVRCNLGDFPEMLSGTWADGVPYAKVRFEPYTVEALVKTADPELSDRSSVARLRLLLLRVPIAALDIDDEWEKDDEHSYSRDGIEVIAVKPKPRLDAEVYVGEPGTDGWQHIGTTEGGVTWA